MTIKNYVLLGAVVFALTFAAYTAGYRTAWKAGRVDLGNTYTNKARQQLAKATSSVQAGETKAATAQAASDKQFEVIESETIKYVTRPNPAKCTFPAERVRIKSAAVEAAGNIPGFDDAPGQAGSAERGSR